MKQTPKIIRGAFNLAYRMGYIDRDDEIVRCKDCVDCKETSFDGRAWKYCETIGSTVNDDDYCCWAERRKDNG